MALSIWSSVRFCRSSVTGAFELHGVPLAQCEAVCARLFVRGCVLLACGSALHSRSVWFRFRCSPFFAGRLALLFPCEWSEPLLVSFSGRVLSGAAESRSRALSLSSFPECAVQREVGRRCWA